MSGGYRRADGAVFSAVDLTQCVLVHPGELTEWVWPIELVEDWLLHASSETVAEFAGFLGDGPLDTTPDQVIEHLGRSAVIFHRLIRAVGQQT